MAFPTWTMPIIQRPSGAATEVSFRPDIGGTINLGVNPLTQPNTPTEGSTITGSIPQRTIQGGSELSFNPNTTTPPSTNTYFDRLNLLSNTKTDTTLTPGVTNAQTNLAGTRDSLLRLGQKQVTKEDIASAAALRPENAFETDLRAGVDKLKDYASGDSLVDRTIANRLLTQSGAMQGAATISQAQRIASNPMLSESAKAAGMMELNRMAGAQRSKLVGELAQQSQERAFTATKDYAQLSLDAAKYNEEKFKTDLGTVTDELNRGLNSLIAVGNIDSTILNNEVDIYKTKITTQLQDVSNSIQANIALGTMTQNEAKLAWEKEQKLIENKFEEIRIGLETKTTDANVKSIGEATASLHDARITTARDIAIESVSNIRMINPNITANDIRSGTGNIGLAYNQIRDAYRIEMGDPNAEPTDDFINLMIQQGRTPPESALILTNHKLNTWKNSGMVALAGTTPKPGQMSEDTFSRLASVFRTASLTKNTINVNNDGSVSILNADQTVYGTVGTDGVYRLGSSTVGTDGKPVISRTPDGIMIPPEVQNGIVKEWVNEDGTQVLKLDSSGEAIEVPNAIVSTDGKTIITTPPDKVTLNSLWVGKDNQIYKTGTGGMPEIADLSNPTYTQLKGLGATNPIVQQAIKTFSGDSYSNTTDVWSKGDAVKGTDTLIKIKDPDGNDVLVRYISNASTDLFKSGFLIPKKARDVGVMTFETTDGKRFNVVMPRKSDDDPSLYQAFVNNKNGWENQEDINSNNVATPEDDAAFTASEPAPNLPSIPLNNQMDFSTQSIINKRRI